MTRIWDDLHEAEKARLEQATPRQIELEAAADAVLSAENYEMDLEVACAMAAETTGADAKEIEAAYRFVNAID